MSYKVRKLSTPLDDAPKKTLDKLPVLCSNRFMRLFYSFLFLFQILLTNVAFASYRTPQTTYMEVVLLCPEWQGNATDFHLAKVFEKIQKQDFNTALDILNEMEDRRNATAVALLTFCYIQLDKAIPSSLYEDLKFYAEQKHPAALRLIVELLTRKNCAVDINIESAYRYAELSAEAGDSVPLLMVGYCCLNNPNLSIDGVTKKCYTQARAVGSKEACLLEALVLMLGFEEEKNNKKSIELLESITDSNYEAQYYLYFLYYNEVSKERAFEHALLYAQAGNIELQCILGKLYIDGVGTAVNLAEGVKWLAKASDSGHPRAMFYMGSLSVVHAKELISAGRYTEAIKVYREAIFSYEMSYHSGYHEAAFALWGMYSFIAETKDANKAIYWLLTYERHNPAKVAEEISMLRESFRTTGDTFAQEILELYETNKQQAKQE